jgi:CBS domain-containing protein
MRVQEIMTTNPAHCTPDTNLREVVQMMVANDCGCIPVVDSHDSHHVVGVITDRDVCVRTIAEGKNPLDHTAQDAMTRNVMTVTPQTHLDDLVKRMEEWKVRRAPVVDEQGNLLGMVAQADIALMATPRVDEMVKEVSEPRRAL